MTTDGQMGAVANIHPTVAVAVASSWEWPEASPEKRQEIYSAHKNYTQELLWFLSSVGGAMLFPCPCPLPLSLTLFLVPGPLPARLCPQDNVDVG